MNGPLYYSRQTLTKKKKKHINSRDYLSRAVHCYTLSSLPLVTKREAGRGGGDPSPSTDEVPKYRKRATVKTSLAPNSYHNYKVRLTVTKHAG